jgi:hypothetical protein
VIASLRAETSAHLPNEDSRALPAAAEPTLDEQRMKVRGEGHVLAPCGTVTMWSWREELREVLWLVLIVGGISTLAVSFAVAVAVV